MMGIYTQGLSDILKGILFHKRFDIFTERPLKKELLALNP